MFFYKRMICGMKSVYLLSLRYKDNGRDKHGKLNNPNVSV